MMQNCNDMREAVTFELLSLTVEVTGDCTIYRNSEGQNHRLYGPALIWAGRGISWYWLGMLHRVGGPADAYGGIYFLFDSRYTAEEYEIECANKTNTLWKEYDAYIRSCNF